MITVFGEGRGLRVVWLLEEPRRSYSIFIKGYEEMKVVIPRRA